MNTSKSSHDLIAKVLLIGDSTVGKTCILGQFVHSEFNSKTLTTTGIDFQTKIIEVDEKRIKLQMWDTAGQERYRSISQAYYKGAMGIILVFALNSQNSFNSVRNWSKQIKSSAPEDVCVVLVANKSDLSDERVVSVEDVKELAEELGMKYFETSAKTGENINEAFITLAKDMNEKAIHSPQAGKVQLHTREAVPEERGWCC